MTLTYKQKFNRKYKQPLNQSNSLNDISRLTGFKKSGLQTIYNKGIGAFRTAGPSRPNMTEDQWAYARVYAAINPSSKAHKIDKVHLKKK
tara:strand:- start:292 stop:561 length:270 start_codon:yes stop_codon:yes gene_type:complete